HPHVPHVRKGDDIVPARASTRASHVGDWLGIVYRDQDGDREPAAVVTTASTHRVWTITDTSLRVDVFVYDMRSRKVLGAIAHVMPIIRVDPVDADDFRAAVERCVLAIELTAETLAKMAWGALVGSETTDAEKRVARSEAEGIAKAFSISME